MMRGTTRSAHGASDRASYRAFALRLAAGAAGAAAVVAVGVFVGCDDFGEKKALDAQAEVNAMRAAGAGGSDAALEKLQGVAGSDSEGPAVIQALQSLGQIQFAKANTSAVELARLQAEADQTLFQIAQLARQARTSLVLANNYRQLDPKRSVEQIGKVTADVRGDGNVESYPIEAAKIPSLAVAQQNKSRLDGEVAKTQEAITAATQERDRLLADAGKASATMEGQTGDQRAASVKQIADLRAKAAAASRKISDLNATLTRAQAEQAEQEGLITQLQAAVESMTAQGASLTEGWQALSAKAADLTKFAQKLVDAPEGNSVRSLTAKLNDQLKEIDARRGDLEQLYKDSIASFQKAAEKAGQRVAKLNESKTASNGAAYEVPAWDREASLIAVDRMNLGKAYAEKGLADFYASRATWLSNLLATTSDVETVAQTLNVGAAEPFNTDKVKADLGKAIDEASEAYDTVIATLEGVQLSGEDLAPLKPARAMTRIVSLSDHAALADLAAANKVSPTVAAKAKELRESMRAAAAEARENNTPLPTLPPSLGGATPTTAPAAGEGAPATTPAEGATPAAEGAAPATPAAEGAASATPPAEATTPPAAPTPPPAPAPAPAQGAGGETPAP